MNYNISVNNNKLVWEESFLKSKLENLGSLSGKKVAWIRADLSTKKSNWLTRLIWTVVAKHFDWMRRHFYGVDLQTSSSILLQISKQIPKTSEFIEIYNSAVTKFKEVAPNYEQSLALLVKKSAKRPTPQQTVPVEAIERSEEDSSATYFSTTPDYPPLSMDVDYEYQYYFGPPANAVSTDNVQYHDLMDVDEGDIHVVPVSDDDFTVIG